MAAPAIPALESAISRFSNSPANFPLVNGAPLVVVEDIRRSEPKRSLQCSKQKADSMLTDRDQLSTYRLNQSMSATKYTNPPVPNVSDVRAPHLVGPRYPGIFQRVIGKDD